MTQRATHYPSTLRAAALSLVLAFGAGCGGGSAPSSATTDLSSADQSDQSDPSDQADQAESGAVDEPSIEFDRSATLVWRSSIAPYSLDIHRTPFNGGNIPVLTPLFDRLVYMDPYDGTLGPMLATGWEASEDATSITFELRDDVLYHDGRAMDAESIVANFEHGRSLGDAHPLRAQYELIESATAVDEFTVRFDLSGAYAGALPQLMASGLGIPESPDSFDREDHQTYEAGTGPYTVVEVRPGELYRMEAFDGYWDPDAQTTAGLDLVIELDEETTLNGVATGAIDGASLSPNMRDRAEAFDVQVIDAVGNTAYAVWLNTSRSNLDDPRVRRAINMAIDREAFAEGPLQGRCTPTVQPWNTDHPAHNPEYPGDYYGHDPEAARALLAEAGFPDGVEIELVTYPSQSYIPVSEVLQQQLAEAGITAEIRQLDIAQLAPAFRSEQSVDTWFTRTPYGQPPVEIITNYFMPAPSNPGNWSTEETLERYDELLAEPDADAQNEIIRSIVGEIVEDPGNHIMICHEDALWVVAEDVVGARIPTVAFQDFRTIGIGE